MYEPLAHTMSFCAIFLSPFLGWNVAAALVIGGSIVAAIARRSEKLPKARVRFVDRDASAPCWVGTALMLVGAMLTAGAWILSLDPLSRTYGLLIFVLGQVLLLVDTRRGYR